MARRREIDVPLSPKGSRMSSMTCKSDHFDGAISRCPAEYIGEWAPFGASPVIVFMILSADKKFPCARKRFFLFDDSGTATV